MARYPSDKFPQTILRPEVVAKHEAHLSNIENDIAGYIKVGSRNPLICDWLLSIFENTALSTVETQYLDSLAITKTRLAMFVILIDDTVDSADNHHFGLFQELIKIPFDQDINVNNLDVKEKDCLEYASILWDKIRDELLKYPKYNDYKDAFKFDIKQLIGSMEYSRFVNGCPNAVNLIENDAYVHHGMMVLLQTDMDLMCSQKFDNREFGKLRELTYLSQKMAKIGNLLGTYPRELLESDMSSGAVIKFYKEHGADFKYKMNKLLNREKRYSEFEKIIIEEWYEQYNMAKEVAKGIKSIDTDRFLKEREFIQEAYKMKLEYSDSS